jgi:hypothetical protein
MTTDTYPKVRRARSYRLDLTPLPEGPEGYREAEEIFRSPERILEQTTLPNGLFVSTVFLVIDHSWRDGPPVLWESMVFGLEPRKRPAIGSGRRTLDMRRYSSAEDAREGHKELVVEYSSLTEREAIDMSARGEGTDDAEG